MAVSISDITKLRKLTGAGLADCKKALEATEGDIEKAIEVIREKGQAVAAKRSDREASEGCVITKAENGFGAIIALKCETDFVANNADFVKLAQSILPTSARPWTRSRLLSWAMSPLSRLLLTAAVSQVRRWSLMVI